MFSLSDWRALRESLRESAIALFSLSDCACEPCADSLLLSLADLLALRESLWETLTDWLSDAEADCDSDTDWLSASLTQSCTFWL